MVVYVKKLKSRAVVLLLLCFSSNIFAQTNSSDFYLLNSSYFKFSFTAVVYNNLEFHHYGEKLINSDRWPSFVTNILYHKGFAKNFGINTGLGMSIVPSNANYNFSSLLTDPSLQLMDHRLYDINYSLFMGEIPVSFQKNILFKIKERKPLLASIEVGFKYNFVIDNPLYVVDYIYPSENTIEVFFHLEQYHFRTSLESYFLKFGILRPSKKKNIIQYNIVVNYSPKKIIGGKYNFYFLPLESYGTFEQGIIYFGFELSYGFARKKEIKLHPN